MRYLILLFLGAFSLHASSAWLPRTAASLEEKLLKRYGDGQRARIERGLRQVGELWRDSDGDAEAFSRFAEANFCGDQATLDALFERFQRRLEVTDGYLLEIGYEYRLHTDLERGKILPSDEVFAAYEPSAHINDDFFANKLAFVALLNFPLTTLDERLNRSDGWTRRQWAETRLAGRFEERVPAEVVQGIAQARSDADLYINDYKIRAHHLVGERGERLFAPGLKLITHWNLRDEIKARYSDKATGLPAQRQLQKVMERIVDQSIPKVVVNNPAVDWDPVTNAVAQAAAGDSDALVPEASAIDASPEPDTRYAKLLALFRANRAADAYSPETPTLIRRRFEIDRQMSEERVRTMLEQVLSAPEFAAVAGLVRERLGRPLEAFDIWYNGFRPRGTYSEAELDAIVRRRFPTAEDYKAAIPEILKKLQFAPERAAYLESMIEVQPSRGPGHAMGGAMRGQKTRLRTRVEPDGMNYKGFNIAVHEMGHNIEQTFSQNEIDYTLLAGVPNTAFTEALAMLLQSHDLELLGLAAPDERSQALATLDLYWQTAEIGGVALVDMAVWHWMYENPDASPAELKGAVLRIARDVWNRFYAPVFGVRDSTLLAIYSHMIFESLYLPDYPVGHLIQCQIEEHVRSAGPLGDEYERMTRFGNLPPDLWMKNATGASVGPEALLRATDRALKTVGER